MSASDDLLVALDDLINAVLDYEKAWSKYASLYPEADNEFRIAKGIAHQVLLDKTRRYVELAHRASGVDLIIGQAIESNEARTAE